MEESIMVILRKNIFGRFNLNVNLIFEGLFVANLIIQQPRKKPP
jgi:hypothetical protein